MHDMRVHPDQTGKILRPKLFINLFFGTRKQGNGTRMRDVGCKSHSAPGLHCPVDHIINQQPAVTHQKPHDLPPKCTGNKLALLRIRVRSRTAPSHKIPFADQFLQFQLHRGGRQMILRRQLPCRRYLYRNGRRLIKPVEYLETDFQPDRHKRSICIFMTSHPKFPILSYNLSYILHYTTKQEKCQDVKQNPDRFFLIFI